MNANDPEVIDLQEDALNMPPTVVHRAGEVIVTGDTASQPCTGCGLDLGPHWADEHEGGIGWVGFEVGSDVPEIRAQEPLPECRVLDEQIEHLG